MKKPLNFSKICLWLLYLFPTALFFSYYPVISLGESASTNFELSIPLIYLVIFDFFFAIYLFQNRRLPNFSVRTAWPKFLPLLFPCYLSLSILWSKNPLRAFLTAGVLWLLYFAVYSIIFFHKTAQKPKSHIKNLQKSVLIPAIFISIWCWLQCLLDVFGITRGVTLLCAGCVSETFGFPHPSGFAIEPQFMGNLLLAPAFLALYLWLQKLPEKPFSKIFFITFFLITTLFLTFSRGAIYSFIIGAAVLIIFLIIRQKSRRPLFAIPLALVAFLFTLNAQGLMSEFSKTTDTYQTGVIKVIDQLTLGIFDLSIKTDDLVQETAAQTETSTPNSAEPVKETSTFSGYVAISTDTRLSLTSSALTLWSQTPRNLIFGIGLGSAGVSLYEANLTDSLKEIVQNEYASLLLESGLLGVLLLASTIPLFYIGLAKTKNRHFLCAIIIAYLISLFFFAGLPNALHIYLLPVILCYNKNTPSRA